MVDGAPLKILKQFKPQHEWLLEEGDMLYLPPGYAHNGIAETDACVTWSIGFRAPDHQELLDAYLDQLRDSLAVEGRYTDVGRRRVNAPARIEANLQKPLCGTLQSVLKPRLTTAALGEFVGSYLTQPKSHVEFVAPEKLMSPVAFQRHAVQHGLRLDLRSRMLYDDINFYLNGRPMRFAVPLGAALQDNMRQLANTRRVRGNGLLERLLPLLYPYWQSGEIEFME